MTAQLKVRVLFDLTLPKDCDVAAYKRALGAALDAFDAADIKPRVASMTFGSTDDLPAVHAEFREQRADHE